MLLLLFLMFVAAAAVLDEGVVAVAVCCFLLLLFLMGWGICGVLYTPHRFRLQCKCPPGSKTEEQCDNGRGLGRGYLIQSNPKVTRK